MQVKFELSKDTKAYLEPDGKHYLVNNATSNILLTIEELEELNRVMEKAEKSKQKVILEED